MTNDASRLDLPLFQSRRCITESAILAAAVLVCLIPFLDKAFTIDDPLFIRTARQITAHPFDFYGFSVNWNGREAPMSEITKNPPLAGYYIALAASVAGWSEISLHAALLLPAIGAILGTYALARRLAAPPVLSALLTLLTPVFMVSATDVMCDVMMLCFWIWAIVLWIDGLATTNHTRLLSAAILVALAAVTKYFGIALIPLLALYALMSKRPLRIWAAQLVLPLAVLALYQWWTSSMYGRGLVGDAASYATNVGGLGGGEMLARLLTGFAFAGGCFAPVFLLSHRLWSRKEIAAGFILFLLICAGILASGTIGGFSINDGHGTKWWAVAEIGLFAAGGISLLGIFIRELKTKRDAESILLFSWIAGTFVFAAIINWTVNGRSFLPMAPAVGILLTRTLTKSGSWHFNKVIPPLILAAAVSILTAYADFSHAASARNAARGIVNALGRRTLWIEGHWGFQYYMEEGGARPLDIGHAHLNRGDLVVIPLNNTALFTLPAVAVPEIRTIHFSTFPWLTTMSHDAGAGFYSSIWGPLPFAFARVPDEFYEIHRVEQPIESD